MDKTVLHWVGVDVALQTFDAAIACPGQHADAATLKRVASATFDRTPEGVRAFLSWLRTKLPEQTPLPARVVMEATGIYSIELTALLCKACPELSPAIANPERTSAFRDSLGLRNKTDRLDARALAFFGLERCPSAYEPLSPHQAELRSLSRSRDDLIETRKAHENQLAQNPPSAFARKTLKQLLTQLDKGITSIEAEMRRVIASHEDFKRDYALLTSIAGVGFVTAAVVLAELGDLRRFGCARQIGAYAGVTPYRSQSGCHDAPGHMTKKGNSRVRQAMYMAALSAITHNPVMASVYKCLITDGKKPLVALGAIMRKLLVLMRIIVVSGKPFNPCGKPCEENA